MNPNVRQDGGRITACGLLRTGNPRSLALVSDILRRSGVRIGSVNEVKNRIMGRIGSRGEPYSCKLDVHLYDHMELSLVEIGCKEPRTRHGIRIVSTYLAYLVKNLEDSYPPKENGSS